MGAGREVTIAVIQVDDYRNGDTISPIELTFGADNLAYVQTDRKPHSDAHNPPSQGHAMTNDAAPGERDSWGSGIEFLMSCIALSVGLGNVWRFPFAALENGGGAFLIPYLIVLILVGKPLYYLEMILGQFSGRGSIAVYELVPLMRGIGYGQVFASAMITTYYASLLALITRYFVASFGEQLPWSVCQPEWVAEGCIDSAESMNVTRAAEMRPAGTKVRTSAEMYFYKEVLKETSTIHDGIGVPDWKLVLCLTFAWICIGLILFKGIKSSGKMSYFLALFPYATMGVLLVRAVTLPGAVDGILYFLTPQWAELLNPRVWFSAVSQVFFSISVCLGLIIMFSSFNRFDHNIYRDAVIVTSLDTVTSIISGIIIFGILGNLAHETSSTDIGSVVKGGTGLAFVSYPDAIAKFEWMPQIFSAVFFFMLFVLGIGSNVGLCVCLTTVLRDRFPRLTHVQAIVGVATVQFGIGLLYLTPGGQYLLNLIDFYAVTLVVYMLAIAELVTVCWLYGVDRLCGDVEFMLGLQTGVYWRVCWAVITPGLMATIMVYEFVTLEPLKYDQYVYEDYVYAIGVLLTLCGVLPMVVIAVATVCRANGRTWAEKLRSSVRPSAAWGPSDPARRAKYQEFVRLREESDNATGFLGRIRVNLFGVQ